MSLSSPSSLAHGEVLLRGRVVLEVVERGVRLDRPPERRVVEHLRDLLAADVDLARLAERFRRTRRRCGSSLKLLPPLHLGEPEAC